MQYHSLPYPQLPFTGRDTDATLVEVPGGRRVSEWGEVSSESSGEDEPRKRRRIRSPSATKVQPPKPSRPGSSHTQMCTCGGAGSPDRDALEVRNNVLMNMPECRLTTEERATVRQILVLQVLKRNLAHGSGGDVTDFLL